ncbi:MAG TPA: ATP-binding protein [Propioniciclava tarda]|nr:ATP-binding protein [Propioniciclava tarda]
MDESRSRDSGGSGLGLAIVAEVVAAHGGSVRTTESDLGGALFTMELPPTVPDQGRRTPAQPPSASSR